jgi:FkbM family methyltransferase
MQQIKSIAEKCLSEIFNFLVYFLKNRQTLNLSREEIRYFKYSFSQFGEDLAVLRYVDELKISNGKYLDIGCFHPIHLSNTFLLYKNGWSGVNIDMNPDKIALFTIHRPNDVNLCCAISSSNQKFMISNSGNPTERLVSCESEECVDPNLLVEARTVEQALMNHGIDHIDYVNIDCEGHDYEVLQFLDLKKYSVRILTIEALNKESESLIVQYMQERGFAFSEKLHWTLLFTKC